MIAAAMRKVRALKPGECAAFVLIDPREIEEEGDVDTTLHLGWGMRVLVSRLMGSASDLYAVHLEQSFGPSAWRRFNAGHGEEATAYFTDQTLVEVADVPHILGFFFFEGRRQKERLIDHLEDEKAEGDETP